MLEEPGPVVGVVTVGPLEHLLGVRVNVADASQHGTNSRTIPHSLIVRYLFAVNSEFLVFDADTVILGKFRVDLPLLPSVRGIRHR